MQQELLALGGCLVATWIVQLTAIKEKEVEEWCRTAGADGPGAPLDPTTGSDWGERCAPFGNVWEGAAAGSPSLCCRRCDRPAALEAHCTVAHMHSHLSAVTFLQVDFAARTTPLAAPVPVRQVESALTYILCCP